MASSSSTHFPFFRENEYIFPASFWLENVMQLLYFPFLSRNRETKWLKISHRSFSFLHTKITSIKRRNKNFSLCFSVFSVCWSKYFRNSSAKVPCTIRLQYTSSSIYNFSLIIFLSSVSTVKLESKSWRFGVTSNWNVVKHNRGLRNFTDSVQIRAKFNNSKVYLNELNKFYNEFGVNQYVNFSVYRVRGSIGLKLCARPLPADLPTHQPAGHPLIINVATDRYIFRIVNIHTATN